MLRASEFTVPSSEVFDASSHLTVADAKLHSSSDGMEYLTVHIKRSKTDQRRQGVTLYTGHSGHPVCAGVRNEKEPGCSWSRCFFSYTPFQLADSSPVTKAGLVTFVSHLLRLIGIDPSQYSGHSFRIGGATSAPLAGLSDYEIKLIGRWNSDCYRRYIRSPLNLFLGYPRKIAQTQAIKFQYANPYTPTDDLPDQEDTILGRNEYNQVAAAVVDLTRPQPSQSRSKRSKYHQYSGEDRAKIAKYSCEHGNKKALQHFSKEYPNLKESTLRNFKKAYQDKLLIQRQQGNVQQVTSLERLPRGRPPLLLELDCKLISFVKNLRARGGVVNGSVISAAAKGLIRSNPSLHQRYNSFKPTRGWIQSI